MKYIYIYIFLVFLALSNIHCSKNEDVGNSPCKDTTTVDFDHIMIKKILKIDNKDSISNQGLDIYDNLAFVFSDQAYCRIYDLNTDKFIKTVRAESSSGTNHANNTIFSKNFYKNGDPVPLIYISENLGLRRCFVERFDGESFHLIQSIRIEDKANYINQWVLDNDNKYLYCLIYGDTYQVIIRKYLIPTLDTKEVVLSSKEIIEQHTISFDVVAQGAYIHKGNLYMLYGYGDPICGFICVNLKSFEIKNYDFTNMHLGEPEGICVYNNALVASWNYPGSLYYIYQFSNNNN